MALIRDASRGEADVNKMEVTTRCRDALQTFKRVNRREIFSFCQQQCEANISFNGYICLEKYLISSGAVQEALDRNITR